MICFVSTPLWDSFEQKEPQPSVTRYRAQPICTVHQPSVTRKRLSRRVQCIHLPRYATEISSRSRQSTFLQSHQQKLQCKAHSRAQYATWMNTSYPVIYSEMPQKLLAEGTYMSTVQRAKLPRQGNPTFFSKLSRQLPAYDPPPSSIAC